ncbi:Uncharacterised protein [Mycobacteroides abscessus subsp. abscessus]|nr:Uncharacterised protein [Mycobacteroides abscessus subsp. abscessus]
MHRWYPSSVKFPSTSQRNRFATSVSSAEENLALPGAASRSLASSITASRMASVSAATWLPSSSVCGSWVSMNASRSASMDGGSCR